MNRHDDIKPTRVRALCRWYGTNCWGVGTVTITSFRNFDADIPTTPCRGGTREPPRRTESTNRLTGIIVCLPANTPAHLSAGMVLALRSSNVNVGRGREDGFSESNLTNQYYTVTTVTRKHGAARGRISTRRGYSPPAHTCILQDVISPGL